MAAIRCCSSTCSGSTSHPAVYIMIMPAMGVISEVIACFARRRVFGYALHGLRAARHRLRRLLRLGAPHVRVRHVLVRRAAVFVSQFRGCRAVGHQGVQLDCNALPGPDLLRIPDALRDGLHRPLHHRRADRPFRRVDPDRRARPRHLFHHRAFPLHHGRRRGVGAFSRRCISGGRRSPASSTRKAGRGSRPS